MRDPRPTEHSPDCQRPTPAGRRLGLWAVGVGILAFGGWDAGVGGSLSAQDKTVDQGVYTTAQAARGAKVFESQCATCHREVGGVAPVLTGERFTRTFSD